MSRPSEEERRAARAAYKREWSRKNADKVRASSRAYYARNRVKIADAQRERLRDPERAAQHGVRCKQWRDANPERMRELRKNRRDKDREKLRSWRERNREKTNAYAREAYQRNPEPIRLASKINRQRRRGLTVTDEDRDYQQILSADSCSYCDAPADSVDHIVPIAEGGTGHWTNLTAACGSCNSRKNTRPLLPFLLSTKRDPMTESELSARG